MLRYGLMSRHTRVRCGAKQLAIGLYVYLSCSLLSSSCAPQSVAPIPVDTLLRAKQFPLLGRLRISPDGRYVAYSLIDPLRRVTDKALTADVRRTHSGVPQIVLGSDVWLTNLQNGETRNLTQGRGTSWAPAWSPDGERLAFFSDSAGAVNVWLWNAKTESINLASSTTIRVSRPIESPVWTLDSERLLVTAATDVCSGEKESLVSSQPSLGIKDSLQTTALIYGDPPRTASKAEAPEKISSPMWDRDIVEIDLAHARNRCLSTRLHPMWLELSPDGKAIAVSAWQVKPATVLTNLIDLVVIDISDLKEHTVAKHVSTFDGINFSWSPNSAQLAYTTATMSLDGQKRGDCFVADVATDSNRQLTARSQQNCASVFTVPIWNATSSQIYVLSASSQPATFDGLWELSVISGSARKLINLSSPTFVEILSSPTSGAFWTPDSGRSMVIMMRNPKSLSSGFYFLNVKTGGLTKLIEEKKTYGLNTSDAEWSIDISADGRFAVYKAQNASHPEDIWKLTGAVGAKPTQVTHINPELAQYQMGQSIMIRWTDRLGQTKRAALLLPAGYTRGRRYPLIVYQYPGAFGSTFVNNFGIAENFFDEMQIFATRGFAVLYPDVPVKAGRPMRDILDAVMGAVDTAIAVGVADPNRLGIIGHSWGGYGVLSVLVQTNRFKAALSRSGVGGDLIRYYTEMNGDGRAGGMAEVELLRTGGTLWNRKRTFIDNSPIFFLNRVQTPLLLTHGSNDSVAPELSEAVFVALRRLGKEVKYIKYQGENHYEATWGYANQADFLREMIDWFEYHIGPNSDTVKQGVRGSYKAYSSRP